MAPCAGTRGGVYRATAAAARRGGRRRGRRFWEEGETRVTGKRSTRRDRENPTLGTGASERVEGEVDPIRRISIRAHDMSKAASRGRTHVSTRPSPQTKEEFSLASDGASTHVPGGPKPSADNSTIAATAHCPRFGGHVAAAEYAIGVVIGHILCILRFQGDSNDGPSAKREQTMNMHGCQGGAFLPVDHLRDVPRIFRGLIESLIAAFPASMSPKSINTPQGKTRAARRAKHDLCFRSGR